MTTVEIEVTADYNTVCPKHQNVCHASCSLTETKELGHAIFSGCWAMANDECKFCPLDENGQRCGRINHHHAAQKWVSATNTVDVELAEMKEKFLQHTGQALSATSDMSKFDADCLAVSKMMDQKMERIQQLCMDLKAICRHANIADELYAVTDSMAHKVRLSKDMDTRRQGEERIRILEEIAHRLSQDPPKPPTPSASSRDDKKAVQSSGATTASKKGKK